MRHWLVSCLILLLALAPVRAQDTLVLGFREYLAFVKKYHPVAKQGDLQIDIGEANLLRSRGGFDPKLEVDYDRKKFGGTEYWDRLNATFKIPTWYGIELKANFEQNEGDFINPDETLPTEGLYSAGVSVSLGEGLWINERMATLRKAKFFREQTKADRDVLVNDILFKAAIAYFDWLQAYRNSTVFGDFLENARTRFQGIRQSALSGDIAAIDTVEAKIAVQNRALSLEQARVILNNKALELSNFLWIGDNIPMELQPNVIPDMNPDADVDLSFEIPENIENGFDLDAHPKLQSLRYKIEGLQVDRRLKANKLLPQIDLEYNFLTETPDVIRSFETQEYKGGIKFRFPLLLRKERGDLKLAKFKVRDVQFEFDNTYLEIQNKLRANYLELNSFENQNALIADIVQNYSRLLRAEERKFSFGESSLFLINSRERQLIDAELKQNEVQNKYFGTKAKLFRSMAINPEGL